MRSWRKLRATQPELFADGSIRVWSQPAAVVDTVIYRWQLESEAEEHRQAVQLVDMFAAAWIEDSMHAAALLQRAQTGIAAGCTGLTQVTDTGFGQPVKAALARWQEELKQRMREKARQQKVQCTYRTGQQDILQDCGSQSWCQSFPEGSDKLGSQYLQDRSRWVEAGLQTGSALDFKPGSKHHEPEEAREAEQKRKKLNNSKKDRVRRKLFQKWREKQGSKTARKELLSVVPTIGKTDKKKAKKKKKKTDSKKPSAADKPSSKKHEAQKEKRKMRQRAADRQEAVADAAVEGALFGKTARVVGDTAPGSLRGLEVVCRKQTDSHVLVECQDRQEWVEQADISLDVGVRVFPLQLDYDSFPAVAAREEAAALGSQTVSKVRYYDTLPGPASYKEASGVLKVLLQAARQEQQPLPAPVSKLRQSDGFNCGLWVLLYLEQEWRRWLGESPLALQTNLQARSRQLNRWLQCLLRTRQLVRQEARALKP
ncbi:unnamed protein product [Symbiodinium microadriaticum]|nr:unnamed protein product [Symbiodinium microadriaticum]CAE7943817.1 unnamed protein product [Symbiodinium sp. KB8]